MTSVVNEGMCPFGSLIGKGAPLAQLGECQTLDSKVVGSNLTRPGLRCCVLEHDSLSSLLSTGSTHENVTT